MLVLFLFSLLASVLAQNISLSLTTSLVTVTVPTTRPGAQPTQVVTVLPAVFNVTYTLTQSSSSLQPSYSPTPTPSPSPVPAPIVLATKLDPAFAVLGVILILTGLPSAFWGHKNRWTSFFLIGFYTLALVCIVLILKFGVLPAVNPPGKTLRGMFVLASFIAGVAGGAVAIFFWKGARYGIGAWGGFSFALWIQSFSDGGIIKTIGFRWILYIGCAMIGFTLSTIPKIHYHILLISTALVGASSFILGVDCFTTAGLKEFYIWNLGFPGLFPKFVDHGIQFPVSQTMQIELGLIGAISLMGIAVQLRILKVLQKKMQEIADETQRLDDEAELEAANKMFAIDRERLDWEKEHPSLSKHGRQDSALSSSLPLMKEREGSASSDHPSSCEGRPRYLSGVSDFKAAPTSDDDLRRASRHARTAGVLPTLDLGMGIKEDVPSNFMAKDGFKDLAVTAAELEDFKRKEELLAEIQTIRRSIDVLKSETPTSPSSPEQSRRPSFASRRTLSVGAGDALLPVAHARPPREIDPRARVQSMELLGRTSSYSGDFISRPTSVPLKESEWDTYIQERKLLQPPAGVTPPITTSPRAPLSPAVQDALNRRKQRESVLKPDLATESSEDIPLARVVQSKAPVTILPPRRSSGPIVAPEPQLAAPARVRTFEELNERHREKMRDIQAPLTQAEKEHAELEAARQRWERSKALEKEAVTRRQAEKVAALEKKRQTATPDGVRRGPVNEPRPPQRHSRSLSADKLANCGGSSSKRLSMLKVEDWQRYQQEAEISVKPERQVGGSRAVGGVPFPNESRRRKSKDLMG